MADDAPGEGWGYLPWGPKSHLWHYFKADGRSLCGKWFHLVRRVCVERNNDNSPNNCQTCRKVLLRNIVPQKKA